MKKITQLLFLSFVISNISFAQTTENFEDETNSSTTFTDNGQVFNITSVGEAYNVFVNGEKELKISTGVESTNTCNDCGYNSSDKFIDNGVNTNGNSNGSNFTIKTNNGNVIDVKNLYLFTATAGGNSLNHGGTVTITGKRANITIFTITKSSGFTTSYATNNGFTFIDFTSEGGSDNSNKGIDELIFSSTGNLDYMALDAFTWEFGKQWIGTTNTDWATDSNWLDGSAPIATDNVVIPNVTNKPIISSSTGAISNDITIDASSSLTIESGGSLIIEGTATVNGNFNYNVNVTDDKWHLISSPVVGEQYDDTWNTANSIALNLPNEAVARYINTSDANGDWIYFQNSGSATTFSSGSGYSLKRTSGGNYTFTGTFPSPPVNPTITANALGGGTENRWTLVGNPFPAHINIATFLAANTTPLTDTHESVYVWNATADEYQDLQTGQIHPGQAFFVSSNVASTSVTFTKAMQSDQNGVTFYKSTSNPKLTLLIANDTKTKSTEINYLAGKTTSLDSGFDIGTFTGQSSSLNIYTHLVSNSDGVDFKRQALPDTNYENMIIPLGVSATAGKEITFTAEGLNLPSGIKIFLEDKITNTFTRLDEANSNYKVTPSENLNGIGRFYIHTTNSALSIDKNVALENVSIYKLDKSTLRIAGLSKEKTTVLIFNLLGKQVLNTSFIANSVKDIDLPNLSKGVYLVQLKTNSGKLNKKIILE
ncbi:MAG: T9SS type A sorting domain-containing protein [Polaribacter sp.]|uniref:T9SS type A sorting domain-containing protein n=1 Tax=Polaribacter sp. TaxID=1920175 RepID=UPI003267D18C